jgi:cytochrome c553
MDRDQLATRIAQALHARDKARRRVPFRKAAADRLFTAAVMHDVDEYVAAQKPAARKRTAPAARRTT